MIVQNIFVVCVVRIGVSLATFYWLWVNITRKCHKKTLKNSYANLGKIEFKYGNAITKSFVELFLCLRETLCSNHNLFTTIYSAFYVNFMLLDLEKWFHHGVNMEYFTYLASFKQKCVPYVQVGLDGHGVDEDAKEPIEGEECRIDSVLVKVLT